MYWSRQYADFQMLEYNFIRYTVCVILRKLRYKIVEVNILVFTFLGYEESSVLGDIAGAVLKACSARFRLDQHFLGVGLHADRVYIHVKVDICRIYFFSVMLYKLL